VKDDSGSEASRSKGCEYWCSLVRLERVLAFFAVAPPGLVASARDQRVERARGEARARDGSQPGSPCRLTAVQT